MVMFFSVLSILFSLLFVSSPALCAEETHTRIFDRSFRTLKVGVVDNFMAPPVLRLNSNDQLFFSFDRIAEDNDYLEYRLVHCNADWSPSSLVEAEYIDGFNAVDIEDYAFSQNTFVHYVNYRITIPNEHVNILHSGNYLLQVYDPESPDDTILQARFMVSENSAAISGASTSRTDMGHYSDWQQVEFSVSADGVRNPYNDIVVEVRQNGTESSSRVLRSPSRVEGKTSFYSHRPELIFPASNEYRRFESVSTSFLGMNVDSQRFEDTNYHVHLRTDSPRADSEYVYDRTQHGRFLVREYNASDSDLGADYITVTFSLEALPGMDNLYVDGEFTHGLFGPDNKMIYNPVSGLYEAQIPLKQGAYNYRFVRLDPATGRASDADIEGNKYETDNEYSVAVYYRPPGARADRLLGFSLLHPL